MKGKLIKFQARDFMLNFGEAAYERETILRERPNAMLAHGKYPFLDPEVQAHLDQKYVTHDVSPELKSLFLSLLDRSPSLSELHFFSRAFQEFHDNKDIMFCVLYTTVQFCQESMKESFGSICEGRLRQVFGRPSKARVTGLYMRLAAKMPGPKRFTSCVCWTVDRRRAEQSLFRFAGC